jgi:hypothetical protein
VVAAFVMATGNPALADLTTPIAAAGGISYLVYMVKLSKEKVDQGKAIQ